MKNTLLPLSLLLLPIFAQTDARIMRIIDAFWQIDLKTDVHETTEFGNQKTFSDTGRTHVVLGCAPVDKNL